jgi:hypothetical protein
MTRLFHKRQIPLLDRLAIIIQSLKDGNLRIVTVPSQLRGRSIQTAHASCRVDSIKKDTGDAKRVGYVDSSLRTPERGWVSLQNGLLEGARRATGRRPFWSDHFTLPAPHAAAWKRVRFGGLSTRRSFFSMRRFSSNGLSVALSSSSRLICPGSTPMHALRRSKGVAGSS